MFLIFFCARVKASGSGNKEVKMPKDMLSQMKDGQLYAKTWPLKRELAAIFIEYRVITATQLGIKVLPMLAVLCLMVQIQALSAEYMPQAIASALFILSIPAQGLLWLGKRANTTLPVSIANWYHEIHEKMVENGHHMPHVAHKPRYQELAELLKQAYDKMDSAFTKNML